MTTEKQIIGNRENALKSTGPKTEEGKLASKMNAVSHGILSRDAILPGEDSSLLAELRDQYMQEFKPVGEMETMLVERIISSIWRLKRTLRCEKRYYWLESPTVHNKDEYGIVVGPNYRSSDWQNFLEYETTIERHIYKAIHEL